MKHLQKVVDYLNIRFKEDNQQIGKFPFYLTQTEDT